MRIAEDDRLDLVRERRVVQRPLVGVAPMQDRLRLADDRRGGVALRPLAAPRHTAHPPERPVDTDPPAPLAEPGVEQVPEQPAESRPGNELLRVLGHGLGIADAPDAKPGRGRYDRGMAVDSGTLQEQLEEIRTQLGWVRDYL